MPYVSSDSQTCHFISSHNSIAMHFALVKLSRNSVLSIDDPLKRGDVESLTQFLVSPSPQVKVKLKLTASR